MLLNLRAVNLTSPPYISSLVCPVTATNGNHVILEVSVYTLHHTFS